MTQVITYRNITELQNETDMSNSFSGSS